MKKPTLPPVWYQTLDQTAAELGTDADTLRYYADVGVFVPAVRVPKASLPGTYPGPSPHLVVLLDRYLDMDWRPDGADMVAPLTGPHRAFHIDRGSFTNVRLADGGGVLVRRSELVITLDQLDELRDAAELTKPTHPAKLRSLYQALALLANEAFGADVGHYSIADSLVTELQLVGLSGSKETYAKHIRDARAELAASINRAEIERHRPDDRELGRAA